jgi:hypothetical protein
MLSEAITMLCRNGLEFSQEFTVEGLLGITLDSKEVFLVNIKERVLSTSTETREAPNYPHKDVDFNKGAPDSEMTFPFKDYERGQV